MSESTKLDWFPVPEHLSVPMDNGDIIGLKLNKKSIYVAKFQDSFFAGNSYCPHAGADLSEGSINNSGEVVCPLHNYKFKLKDGCIHGDDAYRLMTYPVKLEDNGKLYVGFKTKKGWFF